VWRFAGKSPLRNPVLHQKAVHKRSTRLVVYDEDLALPLIKAQLGAPEREALRKALGTDK
jgi:hypothetical protein